ncbi:hypothetical protein DEU56DRAFT_22430 [Suillus clintonianus]|uniref:uncharacterized protein n=1 Tax=Suillus clintonianus TaxID=1904413 RepID=UPI001B86C783|nr:uncharacterized protein DEU56DRAFT_22430 [Suillus clintonianus]KAG2157482.1 hypothetical protein DEU56DRAFT_22430 [Suillus clintonianus]
MCRAIYHSSHLMIHVLGRNFPSCPCSSTFCSLICRLPQPSMVPIVSFSGIFRSIMSSVGLLAPSIGEIVFFELCFAVVLGVEFFQDLFHCHCTFMGVLAPSVTISFAVFACTVLRGKWHLALASCGPRCRLILQGSRYKFSVRTTILPNAHLLRWVVKT